MKTLLLFESNPKSAGVLFTALLKRAAAKAIEMNAACVFATVSSLKKNVLKLMKRYGYKVKKVVKDKYVVGVNEYLICHSNPHALFNDTNTYIASILPCGY